MKKQEKGLTQKARPFKVRTHKLAKDHKGDGTRRHEDSARFVRKCETRKGSPDGIHRTGNGTAWQWLGGALSEGKSGNFFAKIKFICREGVSGGGENVKRIPKRGTTALLWGKQFLLHRGRRAAVAQTREGWREV